MRLRDTLFGIKGKFLLSYNDCEESRNLYKGCYFLRFTRVHSMAQKYKPGEEFHEIIISNYDMRERERSKPYQLNFFDTNQTREVNKIIKENVVYHGK